MKYFDYNTKLKKVVFTEEARNVLNAMIDELVDLGVRRHDKFIDSHQFYGVLKFEIDELFREQGFLVEWFDHLNEAMFNHDKERLRETIEEMSMVRSNFFMESLQVFGVLRKMLKYWE